MTKENYILRDSQQCIFKIQTVDFPDPDYKFWIFGLTFFHNYYVIFDQENSQVGIAHST